MFHGKKFEAALKEVTFLHKQELARLKDEHRETITAKDSEIRSMKSMDAFLRSAHESSVKQLLTAWDRERETLLKQIELLQQFLKPEMHIAPPENELSEPLEHLRYTAEMYQAGGDRVLADALEKAGLDPSLTVEPITD